MTYGEALRSLMQILARIYGTADSARSLADQSGLARGTIAAGGTLNEIWWSILVEASKQGRVARLVRFAIADYQEDRQELEAALDRLANAQRPTRDPGLPTEPGSAIRDAPDRERDGGVDIRSFGLFNFLWRNVFGRQTVNSGDSYTAKIDNVSGHAGVNIGPGVQSISHTVGLDTAAIADFQGILNDLLSKVAALDVDQDVVQRVSSQLKATVEESDKASPSYDRISRHLSRVSGLLAEVAGVSGAVVALLPIVSQAMDLAIGLFG